MQIIKGYTDEDNIRIQLFVDDNNQYHIWIYDTEDQTERIDRKYPSLGKALDDYDTYLEGTGGE